MKIQKKSFLLALLGLSLAVGAGCAQEEAANPQDQALCTEANSYLAACLGVAPEASAGSCDQDQAARILDTDCEQFNAGPGKADGWWCLWNPFIPGCGSSSDGGTQEDLVVKTGVCGEGEARELAPTLVRGNVDFAYDSLGSQVSSLQCALVALRDAEGQIVATDHSGTHGGFNLRGDLPQGDYEVVVFDRYGQGADNVALEYNKEEAVAKVTLGGGGEPPRVNFTLSSYRNGDSADFGFLSESERIEDAVERCLSAQLSFKVVDSCGDEVAPYYDVRRDWAITLTDKDSQEVRYATPLCQPADGDHWSWDGCNGNEDDVNLASFSQVLPGQYTLHFFRIDLPDQNNIDVEEELCGWRSSQQSPEAVEFNFEDRGDATALSLEPITLQDMSLGDCN